MTEIELNSEFEKSYFEFLKNLNPAIKLGLIEKLSNALKSELINKNNSIKQSYGAWKSEKTAEEIITEIYNSRSFQNRSIEL